MISKLFRIGLLIVIFGLIAGITSPLVAALNVPPKPTDIPVVDQSNTLTDEQKLALSKQIAEEREKSGNQIAILIVPTLEGESIEEYSLAVARGWGIGTNNNNNGVLLLVVKDDRRLRIEVGTGLEGALTDAQTGRIIRNDITPLFREEKYFEGIQAGLTSIVASINGEYTAGSTDLEGASVPWEFIFLTGFFGLTWLGSILGRTKSWWAGGVVGGVAGAALGLIMSSLMTGVIGATVLIIIGLIFDKIVSANYKSHANRGIKPSWWAGGGSLGGGRSGGGFGGFGGGSFGGGGSSGSW